MGTQTKKSFIRDIQIKVPASEPWRPKIAQDLIKSWSTLFEPISLIIRATSHQITWHVEIPYDAEAALCQTIYSRYPNAEVIPKDKTDAAIGFRLYHIKAHQAFIFPFPTAEDFDYFDPLISLISAIGNLTDNEEVIYELRLFSIRQDYWELGKKMLRNMTQSVSLSSHGTTADGWDKSLINQTAEKLRGSLNEVELAVKVKTGTAQREHDILAMIWPFFVSHETNARNHLIPALPADELETFGLALSPDEIAALWHLPSEQCKHPRVQRARGITSPLPEPAQQGAASIALGTNTYQGQQRPVTLSYKDRETHVNIIGKSGVGKSTLMHHMIHQDIANGHGVGVIDPHGSLISNILQSGIPPERERDVVLFDMADTDFPIGLNLLVAPLDIPPDEVASRAVSVIRKMFADEWHQGRMETALYAALMVLMDVEGATILDISRLFHDSDFRSQVLTAQTDPIALEFWINQYELAKPNFRAGIADPITNRINKFYRNRKIRRVICQTKSLDFAQLMQDNRIFLANLGGLTDVEAETLGTLLIAKFELATMSRSASGQLQVEPFYLHVDEVQNFTTTSLPRLFSEARKYGLSLAVANQYLQQLEGDTIEAIMGNVSSNIIFGVGPKDAPQLAAFTRPEFDRDDLTKLSLHHSVVKMQSEGTTLPAFSMQTYTPLPPFEGANEQIQRIRDRSRHTYARLAEEVDNEITQRIISNRRSSENANTTEEIDYLD